MEYLHVMRNQFRYEFWADARVIEALSTVSCPRGVELIAHIHICQGLWLNRMDGLEMTNFNAWPSFNLEQSRLLGEKMQRKIGERLNSLAPEDLEKVIDYRDLKGVPRSLAQGTIFTQLLLHGAYHRGQIADEIRRAGGTPLPTDFIVWERE